MKLYPLVFSFRDIIAGNGFVASVSMDGRVLLSEKVGKKVAKRLPHSTFDGIFTQ